MEFIIGILTILYIGYFCTIPIGYYETKKEFLLDLIIPFRKWIMLIVKYYNTLS